MLAGANWVQDVMLFFFCFSDPPIVHSDAGWR
jgi:hypothetical protein